MEAKHDQPPAYGGPQAPAPTWQGQPQQGYHPGASMDYYGQQPQGGPYPPQQPGQYPGQYGQPGGYPPQGAYYPPQGQYQQDRGSGNGCLHALLAAVACCCCLDCLF